MAIAKVILNGVTQMDVTQKTVTAESMLSGTTALKNDGADITGSIASKTSSDLTANGATVTAPAGYYASAASKSVASGSAGTPTATKGTVSNHSVSVTPSVTNSTGYITGGTKTGTALTVSASELVSGTKTISASGTTDVTNYESVSVASGSAKTPATTITANPSISVDASGLITASVSKTQSVTPTVSAGYMASGTAGTVTVTGSGTNQLTTQAAQTIHPSTTDQTIASGKFLTGAQTVKAVTTTNLTAENIVSGVTVKVGDSTDDDCVASVTGTAETGGDDFIVTLTRNSSTGIYEPDCTFAEAKAAYDAGKKLAFKTSDMSQCAFGYGEDENGFLYAVDIGRSGSNWSAISQPIYLWTSTGVVLAQSGDLAYFTSNATATPADVASGKVFYNADGYQVGTASAKTVTGTFMFDSAGDKRVTIPYSGNGYPVSVSIFVTEGIKDTSTAWYQTVGDKAIGQYTFVKAEAATAPTYAYSSSGYENAGYAFAIYKNSTSDATSLTSNTYNNSYVNLFTSANPSASYAVRPITMPNATTMRLYVGYSNYSFEMNVEYTYVISYSE